MGLVGRARQSVRARYRQLMSPRLRRQFWHLRQRIQPLLDAPRRAGLSVVMPVYNVESYLAEAVESVLSQSYRNLELILVDDGSTDTSGALCDEIAKSDRRVRVIHQVNGGLGAARNTGIAAARGKYLAFIDSDDYILPDAYAKMVGSLRRSGSDMVTGNVMRRDGKRVYPSWLQTRSHLGDATSRTLAESPELLFDTVAWNKVFRLKFWRTYVKTFPVRKLYEDTATIFTAMLHANAIDVVAAPVYVWRLRDEGGSITQRLLEPENIDDRFEMVDRVDEMIRSNGLQDALGDRLSMKILEVDLWVYVREMHDMPQETIDRVQRVVRRYWPVASESVKAAIPPDRRICYWLLLNERGRDVPAVLDWYASLWSAPPLLRHDGGVLLDVTDCPVDLAGLPSELLDMADAAEVVANVTDIRWTGPTTVTASGYAYTKFVSDGSQTITLIATDERTGESVRFATERVDSVDSARWTSDLSSPRNHDGFIGDIDVEQLRSSPGSDPRRSQWSVSAQVEDGDVVKTIELRKVWRLGSGAVVGSALLSDHTLAMVKVDAGEPLRIQFDDAGVLTESIEVTGTTVVIRPNDPRRQPTRVWGAAPGASSTVAADRRGDGSFVLRLPSPIGADRSANWRLLALVEGHEMAVLAPAGPEPESKPNPDGLRAAVNRTGQAVVWAHPGAALVTELAFAEDGEIEVAGSLFALDQFEIGLGPRVGTPATWHRATVADGRFRARIATNAVDGDGITRPLRSGNYVLHARRDPTSATTSEVLLIDAVSLTLPITGMTESIKVRFVRREADWLGVEISAPVPDELLGRYAQEQLKASHSASPRTLEDAVFFQVDLGNAAVDSALAIHHELRQRGLPLTLYWGVEDLSVAVPVGGIPIVKRGVEWFETVNSCRYIVNNYGGLWGLSKDPEQRYLQTWHGTPYKSIGLSEARHKRASRSRLEQIARESAEWDAFVSPSPYFSALIPAEFAYHGAILETGYPRNDRLAIAGPAECASMRARLGIDESAKVLLYAPTFREGMRDGWRAEMYDGLDVAVLATMLGPEWHVLLRGHSFNARDDIADRSDHRVTDVTRHPDVNDLCIASDVLVTDYSSLMFDYAATRKPIALFTPDIKQYIAVRGVYFDLQEQGPGPLYNDVDSLAAELRDLEGFTAKHRATYDAFREKFAPWDDGKAAARVVDAFFADVKS